jgi:hypothetical protein
MEGGNGISRGAARKAGSRMGMSAAEWKVVESLTWCTLVEYLFRVTHELRIGSAYLCEVSRVVRDHEAR